MNETLLRQAMARGYCTPENEKKELDSTLIDAMVKEILSIPIEPLVMQKAEIDKMNLYKEVLLDLVEYAELERDREQSYVVVELFKNRFKKEPTLIKHVWDISNKIGMIINNLR